MRKRKRVKTSFGSIFAGTPGCLIADRGNVAISLARTRTVNLLYVVVLCSRIAVKSFLCEPLFLMGLVPDRILGHFQIEVLGKAVPTVLGYLGGDS